LKIAVKNYDTLEYFHDGALHQSYSLKEEKAGNVIKKIFSEIEIEDIQTPNTKHQTPNTQLHRRAMVIRAQDGS